MGLQVITTEHAHLKKCNRLGECVIIWETFKSGNDDYNLMFINGYAGC